MNGEYEFIPNVFADKEWPLFYRSGIASTSASVVSYKLVRPDLNGDDCERWLALQVESLLLRVAEIGNLSLGVFLSNDGNRPISPISRHKGIWGSMRLPTLPADFIKGKEIEITCADNHKFAVTNQLRLSQTRWLSDAAARTSFVIPLLAQGHFAPSKTLTNELCNAAFPPNGCGPGLPPDNLHWPLFTSVCAKHELIFLRQPKFFSDGPYCHIDLIGSFSFLNRIYKAMVHN